MDYLHRLKNWLIHALGGLTIEEHQAELERVAKGHKAQLIHTYRRTKTQTKWESFNNGKIFTTKKSRKATVDWLLNLNGVTNWIAVPIGAG